MAYMQYNTTIDYLAHPQGPTGVTVRTTFANGATETFQTMVDPATLTQVDVTSRAVASQVVSQLGPQAMAGYGGNAQAQNALTGTFIALLKLPQHGVNPLLFSEGQPGFQLLVNTAIKHMDLDHRDFAQQAAFDIVNYVYATKQQHRIGEAGQGVAAAL